MHSRITARDCVRTGGLVRGMQLFSAQSFTMPLRLPKPLLLQPSSYSSACRVLAACPAAASHPLSACCFVLCSSSCS